RTLHSFPTRRSSDLIAEMVNDGVIDCLVERSPIGRKHQRNVSAGSNGVSPFYVQRSLDRPVSWRSMWIVHQARGLHDLQINRGQTVDLRKYSGILGNGC